MSPVFVLLVQATPHESKGVRSIPIPPYKREKGGDWFVIFIVKRGGGGSESQGTTYESSLQNVVFRQGHA